VIKRISVLCIILFVMVMFMPVTHSVPEPPRIAPPGLPVVGHYCVVTSDAAANRGMPKGMQLWMSMNMKNTSGDSADWSCADLPNPWAVPN
jgi:hypothetical protein